MSISAPIASIRGTTSAALPSRPMRQRLLLVAGGVGAARGRARSSAPRRRGSGARCGGRCGSGRRRRRCDAVVHGDGERLRAAHAAEAAGEGDRAGQGAAEPLVGDGGEASRRCPAGCPGCRCRSTSRRSSARTWSGRAARGARNSSQFAQSPTRLELAISTRGAHSWVCSTPTGLPDCTSSVSSFFSVVQGAHDRVEAVPVARGLAGAAVDDELVRALGDLGVEVVHAASAAPPPAASRGCAARLPR